ncbi:MAG: hypothetical protein WD336_10395 [Trueperaceae bacterium]
MLQGNDPPESGSGAADPEDRDSQRRDGCARCAADVRLDFEIAMAFQAIVDVRSGEAIAHEALVRGPDGQGAGWVFDRIGPDTLYRFD